jgi:hypothetical protein
MLAAWYALIPRIVLTNAYAWRRERRGEQWRESSVQAGKKIQMSMSGSQFAVRIRPGEGMPLPEWEMIVDMGPTRERSSAESAGRGPCLTRITFYRSCSLPARHRWQSSSHPAHLHVKKFAKPFRIRTLLTNARKTEGGEWEEKGSEEESQKERHDVDVSARNRKHS